MVSAGYSGTPLAKKLGIGPASRVAALGAPGDYRALVAPWPEGAVLLDRADAGCDLVHLFVRERSVLAREATRLRKLLGDDAVLWVSWPKKAAKVATDITEDGIREIVLPAGNARDLEEVPAEVKADLRFHLVSRLDEVLPLVLADPEPDPDLDEAAPAAGGEAHA